MIKKFTVLLLSFMVASAVLMPVNVFAQAGNPEDDPYHGDRPPVTVTAASTEDKEVQSAPYVRGIEAFGGRVAEELSPEEQKQCPSACIVQLRESGEALPAGTFTANVGGAIVDAMAVKADASDTNNQQLFASTYGELTGREVVSQSEAYDVYNPAANNSVITVSSVTFKDKESGEQTQGYVMYDGNTTQVLGDFLLTDIKLEPNEKHKLTDHLNNIGSNAAADLLIDVKTNYAASYRKFVYKANPPQAQYRNIDDPTYNPDEQTLTFF